MVGGKHVLVDKPMARSAAEAERMHAAATAHSKQVSRPILSALYEVEQQQSCQPTEPGKCTAVCIMSQYAARSE